MNEALMQLLIAGLFMVPYWKVVIIIVTEYRKAAVVTYFSFQTGSKCFLMSSRMESSHIQKLNGFPGIFS